MAAFEAVGAANFKDIQVLTEQVKLQYSEGLIRRAIWAFWWRSTGYTFFGAMGFASAAVVYLVASGERAWLLGVMGTVLVGLAVLMTLLYFVHFRRTITRFRRMGSKQATLEVTDDKFRMSSDLGSSELSWSVVTKIWKFPEFWLLFYSAAQFSIVPVNEMSLGVQSTILERAMAHGAVIA
jgi:YcxB-like protein